MGSVGGHKTFSCRTLAYKGASMNCEKCGNEMLLQYDVEERNVLFVLWDCNCGHKLLERRPQEKVGAAPLATSLSDD
jgi:hypothetical protein